MGFIVLTFGDSGKGVVKCVSAGLKGLGMGELGGDVLFLLAGDGFLNFGRGHADGMVVLECGMVEESAVNEGMTSVELSFD